jgi:hypothetical protein
VLRPEAAAIGAGAEDFAFVVADEAWGRVQERVLASLLDPFSQPGDLIFAAGRCLSSRKLFLRSRLAMLWRRYRCAYNVCSDLYGTWQSLAE